MISKVKMDAGALGKVLPVELLLRGPVARLGMVHALDLRVVGLEEVDDLQGVFYVALHAQGQRLQSLQEEEGVEGRDRCALVPQEGRADLREIGEITARLLRRRRRGTTGSAGSGREICRSGSSRICRNRR